MENKQDKIGSDITSRLAQVAPTEIAHLSDGGSLSEVYRGLRHLNHKMENHVCHYRGIMMRLGPVTDGGDVIDGDSGEMKIIDLLNKELSWYEGMLDQFESLNKDLDESI